MARTLTRNAEPVGAWILLLGTLCILLAPILFQGEIVASQDGRRTLGLEPLPDRGRVTNEFKFMDHANFFVPELQQHLRPDRSRWVALWTPNVELGRPANHAGVWSKAYPLTHALSLIFEDGYALYSWLAVVSIVLLGVFAQLFARASGLSPTASLVASLGLSAGVYVGHWLTFVIYLSVPLWTLALLWAVTCYQRRPGALAFVAIAFFVYCLALSGYPQLTLYGGYLVAGHTILGAWRSSSRVRHRVELTAGVALAALVGLAAAAPVYVDLGLDWARSTRAGMTSEFLLATRPSVASLEELAGRIELLFDALWLGNPVSPEFPAGFLGVSLTPVVAMLATVSFRSRALWWWQLLLVASVVFTWWEPAYRFGISYLGMGISRFPPLAAGYVPAVVLAAHAADGILRQPTSLRTRRLLLCVAAPALACVGAWLSPARLDAVNLAIGLAFVGATFVFVARPMRWLLAAILVLAALHYARPQLLTRPPESVARSSRLVEGIRQATRNGSRYAWVDGWIIPPNQEIGLDLHSVHSRSSLPSRQYHRWTSRLSPQGPGDFGRLFDFLGSTERLDVRELSVAGVGLLLSSKPVDDSVARHLGTLRGLTYYRPRRPPILQSQIERFVTTKGGVLVDPDQALAGRVRARRLADEDDVLVLSVEPTEQPTLLFVSQQHHPSWSASANGRVLETTVVNGVYQGVLLPPLVEEVQLAFLPWARLAWIPQALFPCAGALAGWRELRRRRRPDPVARREQGERQAARTL